MASMFSKAPWAGVFNSQDEKVMEGDEEGEEVGAEPMVKQYTVQSC